MQLISGLAIYLLYGWLEIDKVRNCNHKLVSSKCHEWRHKHVNEQTDRKRSPKALFEIDLQFQYDVSLTLFDAGGSFMGNLVPIDSTLWAVGCHSGHSLFNGFCLFLHPDWRQISFLRVNRYSIYTKGSLNTRVFLINPCYNPFLN